MHDIVLILLRLNILASNVTKSGQADLHKGVISDCVTPKECETNLIC